jgi:hypothetical protein
MPQRFIHIAVFLSIFLLVFLVYSPGLNGPYVLDDGENITLNEAVAIKEISLDSISNALVSNQSGLFKRPLASLSFALNHYFADGFENTLPFKMTNIAIHLANGLLLYYLSLLILRRPVFATNLHCRFCGVVVGFAPSSTHKRSLRCTANDKSLSAIRDTGADCVHSWQRIP